MSWDYRVVRKRNEQTGEHWYSVREVFMDDEDRIWACTEDPIAPGGESQQELIRELGEHLLAALEEDVVDYDLIPEPGAINPTDKQIEELESNTATTIPFAEVRDRWLSNIRNVDCCHCVHWRRRRCTARPLGVRDRKFERASRYAATRRTDWCARFEEI